MDFRILGPLQALDEGRVVALGGSKQRSLLAVLLLHANETLSTERLIDELWGERPPATAAKTVQVHVSRLRKALGGGSGEASDAIVVTREYGYELQLDPEGLDSHRFERLVAEGRAELDAGRPDRAASALEEALSLWRGPPLADLAYESFATRAIVRLEELRVSAREALIKSELALGRHAEVVGELERLVAEHPYREGLRAQLMLALYRCDRQADALQAYQDARRALVEELGIEPGERLRALERDILAQDPALALSAAATESASVEERSSHAPEPSVLGAFVGRDRELDELRVGLEDAIAGRGGLFLLVGGPGIGKSRLAEELIVRGRARQACVLIGRCWEAGGAPAYWPWVQVLRMYLEETEPEALRSQLGGGAADLAQIVPELRQLFPDVLTPSITGEGARFRLFDSAARFLRAAAATRPLLIVLDDLHAADEASLLMLRFVAAELGRSRILVLGTYRDVDPTVRDPLASTLAELAREQVTHRIELAGLGAADIERYIEVTAGTAPPPELIAAIHTETEGNPLFVGEMVRLLAAEGHLAELDARALSELGVPQGVREVIGRRLGRLSAESQHVLTLASVLGREMDLGALERLTQRASEELLEVLDEAVAARVLTAVPGAPGRVRFAHALIRETLYDQLTAPRRVQLHRRAGEALEELYARDSAPHLAELAHHFFEAAPGGDLGKALGYSRRAGERAVALLAYEEGARYYELALQALELKQPYEARERCAFLLERGDALAKAGSMQEAKEAFLDAANLARSLRLPEQLARAALGYGGRYPFARAGPDRQLVPLLEEALAGLSNEQSDLRVQLMARLAAALRDQPSLEPRSSLSTEAVQIARRLGDKATLADALMSHFTATWTPEPGRLVAIADEVGRLAEEIRDPERAFQASFLNYVASLTLGEPERVASRMEEHRALASILKQPALQWWSLVMRSDWALLRGEFAEGEELAEEALRVGQRAQSWDAGFSYRTALFILRREQGRLAEIDELIRDSINEYTGYRSFRCLVLLVDCDLGRRHDAARGFDELAANDFSVLPRDAEWLFCLSILSEVAACLNDVRRAAVLHELLLPYERLNALASGEVCIGCVARYLGVLASTTANWGDAKRHFESALELNARMGARPWAAHTASDYARMRIARDAPGDREKAHSLLSRALATYDELGMPAAAASAFALMTQAGLAAR
jgi:DNA-binding SARP family transcriptional activator